MRLKREVAVPVNTCSGGSGALVLSPSLLFLCLDLATAIMLGCYDSTSGIDEAGGL